MIRFFSFMFFAILVLPTFLYAHGDGRSIEKQIGNYLIDVGYTPDEIVANTSTYFDFKLYEKKPVPGEVAYSSVWVRIEKDGVTLFATGVAHMQTGATGMVYTFASPGKYSVSVRYENVGETLVETSFDLGVGEGEKVAPTYIREAGMFLLGALSVCGIYILYKRRKPRGIV